MQEARSAPACIPIQIPIFATLAPFAPSSILKKDAAPADSLHLPNHTLNAACNAPPGAMVTERNVLFLCETRPGYH